MSPARTKWSRVGRKISARFPVRKNGHTEQHGASSRKVRTESICSAAASCRTSHVHKRNCCPISDRTCNSRSPDYHGETPTPRRRQEPEAQAKIRPKEWTSGEDQQRPSVNLVSTRAGNTV